MIFHRLAGFCCVSLTLLAGAGCSLHRTQSRLHLVRPPSVPQTESPQEEAGDSPVFTPCPAGTPTPDSARLERDPNTILVLTNTRVNGDSGFAHNEISIAVNPGTNPTSNDNYVLGANDYSGNIVGNISNGSCGAYYSADAAQTWTPTAGSVLPTQAGYDSGSDPAVAFDTANNVYLYLLNNCRNVEGRTETGAGAAAARLKHL
jgi:hypothetical protein